MTRAAAVSIVIEGSSDEPVVRRILGDHNIAVHAVHGLHGKAYLDQKLRAFNQAARFGNWLVVRDLDHDAECAARFVRAHLPRPNRGMRFRLAVRALEAWLLADVEGVAAFFGVARVDVPHAPESLPDPKAALVAVARRSRSRAIREDMVPARDTLAPVGPGYVGRIIEFANSSWSWRRGEKQSESLRRCVRCIAEWR
jgi:hypothetical protein